jgi:hypothetical protein
VIGLATGQAVPHLLNDVRAHPDRASHLVICSPFPDRDLLPLVIDLARRVDRAGWSLRFITTEAVAGMIREAAPGPLAPGPLMNRSLTLVARGRLHAKTYLLVDRGGRSEPIVTSANLTLAGIESNIELGVHATATSPAGLRLIGDLRRILERVAYPSATARLLY